MSKQFPLLFSPLEVGNIKLKNRILSTGHVTRLASGEASGGVSDRYIAYQQARAKGGTGLIITEVTTVHETAYYTTEELRTADDSCIEGFKRLADAIHEYDCKIFAQLFHPGRLVFESEDGSAPVAYAPSAVPDERFHTMPRAMSNALVKELVEAFGDAALRIKQAGLDGVEIVASHGFLPAQFLNSQVNFRDDEYGGSFENRLRFTSEVAANIRNKVGEFVVGMRISADEKSVEGLTLEEVSRACEALDAGGCLDYFSIAAGSSASLSGALNIIPPMSIEQGHTVPDAAYIKSRVSKPVFVAGRINQVQVAEQVLAGGKADVCAMTRAMICDPELPLKALADRADDIRACIACNQACIGHVHAGYPISCIQNPVSGRELEYGSMTPAKLQRKILIAGGGPAGMKAAVIAAQRGHSVTLYERGPQLGGQALLAQLLPGRAEFGGIVTNLVQEMENAKVKVVKNTDVSRRLVEQERPDAIVVATGAVPYRPLIEGMEDGNVVHAWQVLSDETRVGGSVVIADWRCDWIGLGLAEKFARDGCHVRLCVNGNMAGQFLHSYVRDHWLGELHKLDVEIIPLARLFGVDSDTAYFQHTISGDPIICENVDTVVISLGHQVEDGLMSELEDYTGDIYSCGDCLAPRTAEEAVLEGLKVGLKL